MSRLQEETIAELDESFTRTKMGLAKGGRGRHKETRKRAGELTVQFVEGRVTKPSRAAATKHNILPEVCASKESWQKPLKEGNAARTVNGWLKSDLDPSLFATHHAKRST
jgi:hypothetical protein